MTPIDPQTPIDQTQRANVLQSLASKLRDKYCLPEDGAKIALAIENTSYDDDDTLDKFAQHLTKTLQSVNNDGHFRVRVNPVERKEPTPEELAQLDDFDAPRTHPDWVVQRVLNDFGMPKIEFLLGRVAYIRWDAMFPIELCKDVIISAFNFVSNAEALIVDLRGCSGGDPDTADLLYATVFDEETHVNDFYWRPSDKTIPRVVGQKDKYPELKRGFIGKPVYILTSPKTFSCGEEIAYTLKTFNKATIVGTPKTGGAAHPGCVYYLNPFLSVFISTGRNINRKTLTDWEGDGVAPDFQVDDEAKALDAAHLLALKHIVESHKEDWQSKGYMTKYLESLESKIKELEAASSP